MIGKTCLSKKLRVLVPVLVVCLLNPPVASASLIDPPSRGSGGSGGNTVQYYYWSPLTVVETITDIGGATYKYEYFFTNVDSSEIWAFGVWTKFEISGLTKFTQCQTWFAESYHVSMSAPEYDPRNLDPLLAYHADTYTWFPDSGDPPDAIPIGGFVSGLSFTSDHYDPLPKWYNYETIASGWAGTNGTGKLAAVGLTVPEPAAIFLLGLGGIASLRKRRA